MIERNEISETCGDLVKDRYEDDLEVSALNEECTNGHKTDSDLSDQHTLPPESSTDVVKHQAQQTRNFEPEFCSCNFQFTDSDSKHSLRRVCIQLDGSLAWSFFSFSMSMLDCLGIALMSEFYTGDYMHDSAFHTLYVFDNLCIGLQGLEIFVGIQAKDFKTWIQDVYNKLELSLLSTALLGFCLSSLGWKVFALRSFRLLRLFKLLSRFEVLSYVKHIVTTLEVALFQLLTVCSILFFFMLTFSLLGMSAYQNSFKRRCVSMEYLSQPCQSYSAPWSSACSLPLEWERDPLRSSWNVSVQGGYPYFELCDIVSSSREDFPMDYLGRRHTCE
eukprot:763402-Hanusia_phi.AAC.1